jgi:hypothetical protein
VGAWLARLGAAPARAAAFFNEATVCLTRQKKKELRFHSTDSHVHSLPLPSRFGSHHDRNAAPLPLSTADRHAGSTVLGAMLDTWLVLNGHKGVNQQGNKSLLSYRTGYGVPVRIEPDS